ncbi:hypothetical protein CPT_Sansa81 [Caulobacter phage Sansa]|uniref:Uncharacterized protein n=1 Tax=Caulobacter phage Sansa TaxID=1675600 RepID=A0A0K1LMY5_9CAUD|nr:hypothetical protein HOR07_gp081 [Caulobacter phage Sansa]AKU43485.1 hypothetical protein CPT_Sansa81 [Caulobacter phage Sansa]
MTPFHQFRLEVARIVDDLGPKSRSMVYDVATDTLRDIWRARSAAAYDYSLWGAFWYEATREDFDQAIGKLRSMTPPQITREIGRAQFDEASIILVPGECWIVGKSYAFLIAMVSSSMEWDYRAHANVEKWKAFITSTGKKMKAFQSGNDSTTASSHDAAMRSLRRMIETKMGVSFE